MYCLRERRVSTEPLRKITVRLGESQLHRLKVLYPNIGYNAILRKLVDAHLEKAMSKLTEGITEEANGNNR